MPQADPLSIFWFRRDLRLEDNAGLYHALRGGSPVLCLFIFDRHILDVLEDRDDARVSFLRERVAAIQSELEAQGSLMEVHYGTPEVVWARLLERYEVSAVYANRDYEAYAKTRDATVAAMLAEKGVTFNLYKDHVIFEHEEIQKKAGGTYTVFTPYSKAWRAKLNSRPDRHTDGRPVSFYLKPYPVGRYSQSLARAEHYGTGEPCPSLAELGFEESAVLVPSTDVADGLIKHYERTRDTPGIDGTSRLGLHFRHGTVSIRAWVRRALDLNETFVNELIWRDFYSQVLQAHPRVIQESFKREYDAIAWRNDEEEYAAWCAGRTGYPLVDAGMRQLNATGYMHNRVRMVTASFLTKHLLIDWRWGERYFARKLLDYELASNNGGWQWAAGTGTDAAPYFRVFNPTAQLDKFDRDRVYVRTWVEEFGTAAYPEPIVDHAEARARALATYKEGLARARAEGYR